METWSIVFGGGIAFLHGLAYSLYSWETILGRNRPNIVSWGIWTFIAIVNALSYYTMIGKDGIASLQYFSGSVMCLVTFICVLFTGRFLKPAREEWFFLGLGIFSVLVWWFFRSAVGANAIILITLIISFIPTMVSVAKNPTREVSLPWIMWSVAFIGTLIHLFLRGGGALAFLTPTISLLLHGGVAFLILRKRILKVFSILTYLIFWKKGV